MAEDPTLERIATDLADAVEAALPVWVEKQVARLVEAWTGSVDEDVQAAATEAGQQAATDVGTEVRMLLSTDVDQQLVNPLALLRDAVRYPAAVLAAAGVPEVERSAFDEEAFPDDIYGLTPATWSDIDPALHDLGIAWGAAKAHTVLARRRGEGRR